MPVYTSHFVFRLETSNLHRVTVQSDYSLFRMLIANHGAKVASFQSEIILDELQMVRFALSWACYISKK